MHGKLLTDTLDFVIVYLSVWWDICFMFRTSHDSRGQPQTFYDAEFAGKQAALSRTRGDLSRTQNSLAAYQQSLQTAHQMIERSNILDGWRQAVINSLANAAQDEHALASGYKAALEYLLTNPQATAEQLSAINEAARKAASRDGLLLDKTIEIQRRLKPRGIS